MLFSGSSQKDGEPPLSHRGLSPDKRNTKEATGSGQAARAPHDTTAGSAVQEEI
jgi:hypothetical protein